MSQSNCNIITSKLCDANRKNLDDEIIKKRKKGLDITFLEEDTLDEFEANLNKICGKTSYIFKRKLLSYILSAISVIVIMFALISASIYEDLFKKMIFEMPFDWSINDSVALVFVLIFFFGLVSMPSILDGESSQFKTLLQAWFNKDARRLKRLNLALASIDKKVVINLYNVDLASKEHWIWSVLVKALVNRFTNINFYIRNDQSKVIYKRLKELKVLNIDILKNSEEFAICDLDILLSTKEQKLLSLLQLSSSLIIKKAKNKEFISLELFEYCGRNFLDENKTKGTQLISGFQNFINRSFDDFRFLKQEKSMQIYFTPNTKIKELEDEQRRLSYYLRNHIEECVRNFENPISLLILYYYVKNIVLDEKRNILILEKFLETVEKKQHYELIDEFWFDIAKDMFDASNLEDFESTNNSIYRKISITSLNRIIFLFERNGHFEQALRVATYLYEVNPNKYAVNICSLYERMGQFNLAYESLPLSFEVKKALKPTPIEVRYFQRKAWIIVSQRREEKKQEGIECLEKLKELLFSHNEDNEPLWLWHYYNIKANYEEWNKNYTLAIENYKKCLSIPALGAFEYGATFVNLSIAYRFMYLTNPIYNQDIIQKSIDIGSIGVALKNSVGDRDEMPVVLHNQALNFLYKKELSLEELEKVLALTSEGISILDNTNSIKRLGMLLIENIISCILLENSCNENINRLEAHWQNMDNNEHQQILNIYKEYRLKNKLKGIKFLEELI